MSDLNEANTETSKSHYRLLTFLRVKKKKKATKHPPPPKAAQAVNTAILMPHYESQFEMPEFRTAQGREIGDDAHSADFQHLFFCIALC